MPRDERPESPQQQELAELFRTHGNGLAGLVRGILGPTADTQEILQDAFLKAWRSLHQGVVPDNSVAWLFVITMNLAKDHRRKEQRRSRSQPLEEVSEMELRSAEPGPSARLERTETVAAARQAIVGLKTAEKEVFLLRTSAGLTFEACAEALGIPVGTAKTRMRAALIHLRHSLRHLAPGSIETNTPIQGNFEGRQAR